MSNEWFECSVEYMKVLENGMEKKVKEPYLVEALSFAEAENRFIEEIQPFMKGEYSVNAVVKRKIAELFDTEDDKADRWYKAKVNFITYDEKTMSEKKTSQFIYVKAENFHDALSRFDKGMAGTVSDYEIISITETAIMDVFYYNYEAKEE